MNVEQSVPVREDIIKLERPPELEGIVHVELPGEKKIDVHLWETVKEVKKKVAQEAGISENQVFLKRGDLLLADDNKNLAESSLQVGDTIVLALPLPEKSKRAEYLPPGLESDWAVGTVWQSTGTDRSMSGDEWLAKELQELEPQLKANIESGNEMEAALLGYRVFMYKAAQVRRAMLAEDTPSKERTMDQLEKSLQFAISQGNVEEAARLGEQYSRMLAQQRMVSPTVGNQ